MVDVQKIREIFPREAVLKDQNLSEIFKEKALPAFIRDWVLARKADANGEITDKAALHDYLRQLVPNHHERESLLAEARGNGSSRKFLTRLEVQLDIATNMMTFSMPDLNLDFRETLIEDYVWDKHEKELLAGDGGGRWGVVKLGYNPPNENSKFGKVTLLEYKDFCPYQVKLDFYREARRQFTIDEWLDVLLGAIDYRAEGYSDWDEKHAVLTRLLPFVQPNLNLLELAPKGTGKSYVFGTISKYGWLVSGGVITRAKLIFDLQKDRPGLIAHTDVIAIDEIHRTRFEPPHEMQASLQGYMEQGVAGFGSRKVSGNAGIVLLGNVNIEDISDDRCMISSLPAFMQESAFLDRIHGLLLGTRIPRMHEGLKLHHAWGLNSEYFIEIMHKLRDETQYGDVVNQLVECQSSKPDTRDVHAVHHLCTGFLKLLFPHVQSPEDIDPTEFRRYCLAPAVRMRHSVRCQQIHVDPQEFGNKALPVFEVSPRYGK